MSLEVMWALVGFSLVSSITPGPNNLMLLASGVNFGFSRTIPHMLGVAFGFAILLTAVGVGLGQLLESAPAVFSMLKFACAAYLLYLAWRIANAGPVDSGGGAGRPLNFVQAAAFQWVNPKAWFMGLTAMAVYTNPESYMASVAVVVAVFVACAIPSETAWCGMGTVMRRWLSDPFKLRAFNFTAAILLVATLWPVFA